VKIFLDTHVLVSAVISRGLCRDLLRTAMEEHDVVASQLVIDEFERVLREKFGATQPALDKALMLLDGLEVTTNPTMALEVGALKTNDALIVTAAIDARADVLVTGDHGMLEQEYDLPIDVLSPRGFMERLRGPDSSYPSPLDENGGSQVSEDTAGATRQKAFEFALSIIALCKILDDNRQYILSRQLLRAGTSIGANIEEASAAESRRDFAHKMAIASKEARETNYWLRLLDQSEVASEITLKPYLEKSLELIRLLTAIVKTTARTTR
jgi:putative PIN family toxin of toxin-antitoxin system